jgi:hypothetical protein
MTADFEMEDQIYGHCFVRLTFSCKHATQILKVLPPHVAFCRFISSRMSDSFEGAKPRHTK